MFEAAALAALEHDVAAVMIEVVAQQDVAPGCRLPQVIGGTWMACVLALAAAGAAPAAAESSVAV